MIGNRCCRVLLLRNRFSSRNESLWAFISVPVALFVRCHAYAYAGGTTNAPTITPQAVDQGRATAATTWVGVWAWKKLIEQQRWKGLFGGFFFSRWSAAVGFDSGNVGAAADGDWPHAVLACMGIYE